MLVGAFGMWIWGFLNNIHGNGICDVHVLGGGADFPGVYEGAWW